MRRHRGGNQGRARVAAGIQNVRFVDDAEPGTMHSPTDTNAAITAGTGAMFTSIGADPAYVSWNWYHA